MDCNNCNEIIGENKNSLFELAFGNCTNNTFLLPSHMIKYNYNFPRCNNHISPIFNEKASIIQKKFREFKNK